MKVAVAGTSVSKFGELWRVSPRKLVRDVVEEALRASALTIENIDALYVGNMLSGILGGQENLGALFAHELGLSCPAFKIEGACASGGLAIFNASLGIRSCEFENVLVVGIEKMTDHQPFEVTTALMGAGSEDERKAGVTFPGLYALLARAHMVRYGTTEEDLAHVAVKNHYHGSLNPQAHFRKQITIDNVMKSPYVTDPLKLLDCSPVSDGAATVVLTSKPKISNPIWIVGASVATDTLDISQRKELTELAAVQKAAQKAYSQAGLAPCDIDVAEVHDCFTIAEIMAMEDLGFYEKGKAAIGINRGETTLGVGKLIVNTSGGLKSCGHPVGATGVKQIAEIAMQLKGESGERQVGGARHGLTHNVGGSGAVAVVHILKSD